MNSMHQLFGLGLFASVLGGCAVSTSLDPSQEESAQEKVGEARQADSAAYLQTFDEYVSYVGTPENLQREATGVVLESMGGQPRRLAPSELARMFDTTSLSGTTG